MQINRHNYEEFFLMYVDLELSAAEREMVDAFIQQNPDLKAELDLLRYTVSGSEKDIHLEDKEKLMAINGFREEDLLTYLDEEIAPEMAAAIEKAADENDNIKQRLALLEKLYFKPDTSVVYPGKDVLYRRARVKKMDWWKMAIAASLLLLVSAWLFLYKEETEVESPLAVIDTTRSAPAKRISPQAALLDTTPAGKMMEEPRQYVSPQKKDEPKKNTTQVPVFTSAQPVTADLPEKKTTERGRTTQVTEAERTVPAVEHTSASNIPGTAKEIKEQPIMAETAMQTAVTEIPEKEKKNSLLKKIGKKISDRALDILSGDGDDIHVAGFAINLKK
ncbi:anti-sigma factor family protein [Niabella aquatica]